MYEKVCYTQSIIIDLTRLISFELRRVIDENACKELLNVIPVKKMAPSIYIYVNMIDRSCYEYYTLIV